MTSVKTSPRQAVRHTPSTPRAAPAQALRASAGNRGWAASGHTNQETINHYAPKGTAWGAAVAQAKREGVDLNAAAANRAGRVAVQGPPPRTNQDVVNHYTANGASWAAATALAQKDGVDLNAAAKNRNGLVAVSAPPTAVAAPAATAPSAGPAAEWKPAGHTNQEALNHYSAAAASWADAVALAKKDGVDLYTAVKDRSGPVSLPSSGGSGILADPLGLSARRQGGGANGIGDGIERHVKDALGVGFENLTGEKPLAEQGLLEKILKPGALEKTLSLDGLWAALNSDAERLGDSPENLDLSESVVNTIKAMEAKADKAGPRALTAEVFRKIVPELSAARARELLPHLNQAMVDAKITTPRQQAAFIAQCAHETGGFRTLKEYGGPTYFKKYNGRADLGNTQPGDGPRFPGRGAIQITGRANYTAASKDLFGDRRLVDHPELAEKPDTAFKVASWFWNEKKLNAPSEAGDLKKVTRRINGGMNGWADRLTRYTRALNELSK